MIRKLIIFPFVMIIVIVMIPFFAWYYGCELWSEL